MQRTAMRFAPVYARDFTLNLDKRILLSGEMGPDPSVQGVFNIAGRSAVSARELIGVAKEANPTLKTLKLPYAPALAAIWCVEEVLQILEKDSMLSIYNFRKLF